MAAAQVCPVIGTTNHTLPPSHPSFDLEKPGQTCPITGATTDHHNTLTQHPKVPIPNGTNPGDASKCPVMKEKVTEPQSKAMDDQICPVVGTATSVLPPDHPSIKNPSQDECPVTKAKLSHHQGKIEVHPPVNAAPKGAVCPVVGAKA